VNGVQSIHGTSALVIGAGSGVGRAAATALHAAGARVAAVARRREGLETLRSTLGDGISTTQADAADPASAQRLLREFQPALVVLTAGVRPLTAALDEQSWETFSAPWNADTRAAFHLLQAALALPLQPGSCVVLVSSGAAIGGSPLSGGYAGAKRMQWWLAEYAQDISDRRGLGIRFLAVVPLQLIEGTDIGNAAAAAYGARRGISAADLFAQNWNVPLDADKVAAAIVDGLRGAIAPGVMAVGVSGEGVAALE
jgi:NAD(P)-dependent dehydrogenase (short-subunit alcohol dehydrogenase family)